MGFAGWHLIVLLLIVLVPIVVIAGAVIVVVALVRRSRVRSEERVAQRAAAILGSEAPR